MIFGYALNLIDKIMLVKYKYLPGHLGHVNTQWSRVTCDADPRVLTALLVTTGDTGEILASDTRAGARAEDAGLCRGPQLQQIGPVSHPPPGTSPHHQHSP